MKDAARLPKAGRRCKAGWLCLLMLLQVPGQATDQHQAGDLRDCIARAADAGAVVACERAEQAALIRDIERWSTAIRDRLADTRKATFDRNAKAWQAYVDSERILIDLTLAQRADGLAARLRPGLVTQLYEARERQLREHLHNLSFASKRPPPGQ